MKKIFSIVLCLVLVLGCVFALTACSGEKVIMLWGPQEHKELYLKWAEEFKALHEDELRGYTFDFAGSGDAGAYSNMQVDPTKGAALYTFANDQMANLNNLNALSPVIGEHLAWSQENNIEAAVLATMVKDKSMAYPLQADNGYFLYFNKDAFRGTSVWDTANETLKEGFTFRDLYTALDEKTDNWKNGKVSWAMGDSWYVSGVFFSAGGDYDVQYNLEGKQTSASCTFGFQSDDGDWKNGDYTVGYRAVELMCNTFLDADGKVNPHFEYSDGDKAPLNDMISRLSNPEDPNHQATPLAAVVVGTWKAAELSKNWGDNYAATVLPMLEDNAGNKYAMKTFAGYKHLGVNPMCEFARENPNNIVLLHEMAQFISSKSTQIERYESTGAGPANKEALNDPAISSDIALLALNAQYARVAVYPAGPNKGQPVGNGLGFRTQDSVPANYWSPIQLFGQTLWQEYSAGKLSSFSAANLQKTLAQLQVDIELSSQ